MARYLLTTNKEKRTMRKSKIVQSIGLVIVVLSLLVIMLSISVSATSQGGITFSCTEFDSVRGEAFTTTVYVQEGSNVTGLDLTLTYNSEYVTLESYDVVRASEVNVNGNTIEIHYADADNVITELELVELTFNVDDNLAEGVYSDWLVWSSNFEDDAFTTIGFNNGIPQYENLTIGTAFPALFIRQQGDAYNNNYDGKVNARDASYILQHAAHMFTMPAVDQRYANVYTNDNLADGTAKISARDASLILQYAAHMDVTLSDRINVTFYALDESGNYTVQVVKSLKKGSDLTKLPAVLSKGEGKEGSWSASADGFAAPNFTNITESFSVYAYYNDAIFNITYDFNGKQGIYADGVSNPLEYTEKDSFILKDLENVPGYDFIGWYNNFNQKIDKIEVGTTGNITLTAKWRLVEYTITYDCGNGTNSSNNITANGERKYTIESPTFTLADADLPGFAFLRWEDEQGNAVAKIEKGTTGNIHLTAIWTTMRYVTVPVSKIQNPRYSDSFYYDSENNIYTFVYYLGCIENVPMSDAASVFYNGLPSVTAGYVVSSATTTSIANSLTTAKESTISTNISSTISAKEEVEIPGSKTSIEASISASIGTSDTISESKTVSSAVEKSSQTSTSIEFTIPDGSPTGYYRMVYMGTVDMFSAIVYDAKNDTYEIVEYSLIRDTSSFALDYSTSSSFDDHLIETIDFDIPKEAEEYIVSLTEKTEGLVIHTGTGLVTAYNGTATDVVIPSYYNGIKVTGFAEATSGTNGVFANKDITSVKFGQFIESIPAYTFYNCTSLQSVEFSNRVTSIGDSAFYGCRALDVSIPDTVTTIGESAFANCDSIASIVISGNITSLGNNVFADTVTLNLLAYPINSNVVVAVANSGAKNITIDCSKAIDSLGGITINIPDTVDTFLFNGASKTFSNFYITSYAQNTIVENAAVNNTSGGIGLQVYSQGTTLNNVAVTMSSNTGNALKLYNENAELIIRGTVTLTGCGAETNGTALVSDNGLHIHTYNPEEAATLNANGGVGFAGGNGISVNGTLTISEYITLNVTGGAGTRGYDGNCGDSQGSNGENGGIGGAGGIGICADVIYIHTGTVNVIGGAGGQGGSGGCCNPDWGSKEYGGNGGTGGAGGIGISANSITIDGGILNVTGGSGGKGGDRGGVYKGQSNGVNGSFGSGGRGGSAINDTCTINDEQGLATLTGGINGPIGTGSDCRDH
jgi:uncharacterized repeat protein (TIGR02543 family)